MFCLFLCLHHLLEHENQPRRSTTRMKRIYHLDVCILQQFVSDLYHHVHILKLWCISCFNHGHGHADYVVVSCTYDTDPAVTVNNH